MERRACTPRAAVALMRAAVEADVRDLLPRISVPTVVVHHPDHPLATVEGARYLAAHIPGARYLEHEVPFSALEEVISRRGLVQVVEELITGPLLPDAPLGETMAHPHAQYEPTPPAS
jgi:pimeloyl-ACP methyl ester carboxylesterase